MKFFEMIKIPFAKRDLRSNIPVWVEVAMGEIGTRELIGNHHNQRIVEYHQATKLKANNDEVAWCSAFVNWCFLKCGVERTNNPAAISWMKWGVETNEPRIGDIAIFRRVDSNWRGHVGFFIAEDKERVLVLGGNQSNEVCFQWYPKHGNALYLFQYRRL